VKLEENFGVKKADGSIGAVFAATGGSDVADVLKIAMGGVTLVSCDAYDISLSVAPKGTNNSVNASVDGIPSTKAVEGAAVALAIMADAANGYLLSNITAADANGSEVTLDGEGGVRTFTMPAKAVTVTAVFRSIISPEVSIDDWTYGEKASDPAIIEGGNPGGGEVIYSYYADASCEVKTTTADGAEMEGGRPANAGDYWIKAIVPETDGYYGGETPAVKFIIRPAEVTLTANSRNTDIYDDTLKTVTGFTASVAGLSFTGISASGSGTNAGEYAVTFKGVTLNTTKDDTGNYVVTGTADGKLTINKRSVTLTSGSSTGAYTGTALTNNEVNVTGDGFAEGEGADFNVTGSQTDVGFCANTFIYRLNDGTVADNYKITVVNGTLKVIPAATNNVTVSITGWTYGDEANKPSSTADFGADTVQYTYSGVADGEYSGNVPSMAGTWYVKASVTATDNYAAGSATAVFEIAKKPLTITADSASKVVGEDDPVFTGSVSGLIADGDLGEVTFVRTGSDSEPGTYEGVITAEYTENQNYDVTVVPGDFTIKSIFTLKWLNDDGSVLKEKTYIEGEEVPVYDGKEPSKAATAQYTYTFSGWDEGTVEGAVTTYKSLFSEKVNQYTVTFMDYDGKTVIKEAVAYDYGTPADKIVLPEAPTRKADAEYTYKFIGWTPELAEVTENVVYTAVYTSTPIPVKKGILTFDLGGGTLDGKTGTITIEANVGDMIKLPAAPTREGYTFRCWKGSEYEAGAEYKVEGDHAFTAEWTKNTSPSGDTGGSSAVNTGDSSQIGLWLMLLAASLLGLAIITSRRKRA
jgi:hypothetical protein